MSFLRGAAGIAGDDEIDRGEAFGFAASASEESDGLEAKFVSGMKGGEDIGRIAARRDTDHEITGLSETFDLAREGGVITVVIDDAGQECAVGVERDSRNRAAVFEITPNELGGKMLSLGRAATVATDEKFFPGPERFNNECSGAINLGANFFKRLKGANRGGKGGV